MEALLGLERACTDRSVRIDQDEAPVTAHNPWMNWSRGNRYGGTSMKTVFPHDFLFGHVHLVDLLVVNDEKAVAGWRPADLHVEDMATRHPFRTAVIAVIRRSTFFPIGSGHWDHCQRCARPGLFDDAEILIWAI